MSKAKQECPHNKCTNNKGGRCILIARLYEECNEVLGERTCPECGGPATHPSGLCRDCHQGKLEAEEVRLCDNLLAPELYGTPCENNLLCRDCPRLKEAKS